MTLTNGLTLGGMFSEKEKLIKQLENENKQLRNEKAQLIVENQTAVREQAQKISDLNEQLRLLTGEQTKHFTTIEILDAIKLEKKFMEEELNMQYENSIKSKDRISELEKVIVQLSTEKKSLSDNLEIANAALVEERKESHTLSCLVGQRDVAVEQLQSNLSQLKNELEILKHSLQSKDTKLRNVIDERNRANWKLDDYVNGKAAVRNRSNIVTPTKVAAHDESHTASPTTITDELTPEKSVKNTMMKPIVSSSFDIREKHYLSLIYRLRSEISKLREEKDAGSRGKKFKACCRPSISAPISRKKNSNSVSV